MLMLSTAIFLINIPFGYWRADTVSKSFEWFVTIHIPVIIIIILRFYFEIDFSLTSVLINILSFVSGQFLGMKLFTLLRRSGINGSSCLIMDLRKFFSDNK